MKKTSKNHGGAKAAVFTKRNIGYFLLILGVLAVAAIITLAIVLSREPVEQTGNKPIKFGAPVASYTLGDEAALDKLVYSSSMNKWATHNGTDFICVAGTEVLAVMDGTVTSVKDTALDGMVIVITHKDGVVSIYKALATETMVEEGATVTKGQVIGTVAESNLSESKIGAHLHLEMKKDGTFVDPASYIDELTGK